MDSLNLTTLLGSVRDSYAKKLGDFLLFDGFHETGDGVSTWDRFRSFRGEMVRVLYFSATSGKIRDIVGRQGVHNSSQDGTVEGTGHAMTNRQGLTLSFHTHTHEGRAVNTGAGKGYRTLRADRILAINANGQQYVTDLGRRIINELV
jgi:hypothetical protein